MTLAIDHSTSGRAYGWGKYLNIRHHWYSVADVMAVDISAIHVTTDVRAAEVPMEVSVHLVRSLRLTHPVELLLTILLLIFSNSEFILEIHQILVKIQHMLNIIWNGQIT